VKNDALVFVEPLDVGAQLGPKTRSRGRLSGATTRTAISRARNEAATSSPMKLAPMTTALRAEPVAAMMARQSVRDRR
jgi:hypothetical protein